MNKKLLKRQKGFAFVTVLMFSVLIAFLAFTSAQYVQGSNSKNYQALTKEAQAGNIAKSGLQEGLSWFNRQATQPVKYDSSSAGQACADQAFFPKQNTLIPEKGDTIDQSVGLVKDVRIHENLYGRFILKRQNCSTPSKSAVRDITLERGRNNTSDTSVGQGIAWYMESEGILYYRKDPNIPITQAPNQVISKKRYGVEINRLRLSPPSKSVITTFGTGTSTYNTSCEVAGDNSVSYGVYLDGDAFNPTTAPSYSLGNSSATEKYRETGLVVDAKSVFGVTLPEMRALADNIYYNVTELPDKLPMAIHYLQGNFTFNLSKNLQGQGVLIVDGNLTLAESSASLFDGLIFVTGLLTIEESNNLSGAVIASRVDCTPTNAAFIEYNDFILEEVRSRIAGYRMNNLTLNPID